MSFINRIVTSAFRAMLTEWFLSTSHPEARKFLEKHLQLLHPESEQMLEGIVQQFLKNKNLSNEEISKLIEVRDSNIALLRRAIAAGKTRQAVRDAYIDTFSSLRALELPDWLATFTRPLMIGLYILESNSPTPASLQNSRANLMPLLQDLIGRAHSSHLEPETLADLQFIQGTLLMEENPTSAIGLLTEVARVFCWQRFPKRSALVRKNLGWSYFHRMTLNDRGNSDDDTLYAIVCFEAALEYYTPEIDIGVWRQLKLCLSQCYEVIEDYDNTRQILYEILSMFPSSETSELSQKIQEFLAGLEERLQRHEHFRDMIELEMPDVGIMVSEKFDQELNEKLSELERVRAKFSELCN